METIGQWVKDYLKNHQIKAKQLADMVGCHPSFISRLLEGTRKLAQDTAIEWNNKLGLTETERISLMEITNALMPGYHPVKNTDLETLDVTARNLQLMGRTMERITNPLSPEQPAEAEALKVGY